MERRVRKLFTPSVPSWTHVLFVYASVRTPPTYCLISALDSVDVMLLSSDFSWRITLQVVEQPVCLSNTRSGPSIQGW